MVIASPKLKCLDINYLAAGTSLENLYSSYGVSSPKGTFPYHWCYNLDKLKATSLPPKEAFFSALTNKSITAETYQSCIDVWNIMQTRRSDVKPFGDYTRYYNDRDILGLVETVQKMICVENDNRLDIFKESASLPGMTQRYLFKNFDFNDYFVGFGRGHKHL